MHENVQLWKTILPWVSSHDLYRENKIDERKGSIQHIVGILRSFQLPMVTKIVLLVGRYNTSVMGKVHENFGVKRVDKGQIAIVIGLRSKRFEF